MKAKPLIILVVLCVLTGISGYIVHKRSSQTWSQSEAAIGKKLFPDLPINNVAKVTITTINDTVELTRQGDRWVVASNHGYPADFPKIANLVKSIAELSPVQTLEVGEGDYPRLQLNPPDGSTATGTNLVLADNTGKQLAVIRLGKEHMAEASKPSPYGGGSWPNGRFILLPTSGTVVLVNEAFSSVSDNHTQWIDKTFIKISKPKRVIGKSGDETLWTLSRAKESDKLTLVGELAEKEELNSAKISSVGSAFSYGSFNNVMPKNAADADFGFDERKRTYIAETFDGFTYTVQLGKKANDGTVPAMLSVSYAMPQPVAAPEGETPEAKATREQAEQEKLDAAQKQLAREKELFAKWVFFLPSYTASNLTVERADLVKIVEDDAEAPEATE